MLFYSQFDSVICFTILSFIAYTVDLFDITIIITHENTGLNVGKCIFQFSRDRQ